MLTKPGATLLLAALLLVPTACSDGDTGATSPSSPGTSSAPGSPSASATDDPASPSTSTAPSGPPLPFPDVEPAAGVPLRGDTVQVSAPEGWKKEESLLDFDHSASAGSGELILLADQEAIASDDLPELSLDKQAEIAIQGVKAQAHGTYERLPDLEIDGVVTVHYAGTEQGGSIHFEGVTIEHEGRRLSLTMRVRAKSLEREPDLLESVINSWTWL